MCFVLVCVGRHRSFFLCTLHLLLAELRPSLSVTGFWWQGHCPLKAAWPGGRRWQNGGVEVVLVCFLGAGDPSPSALLQHSDDCAAVCLSRRCVLLGFVALGMQESSWKKEGLDFFEEKRALKEHNLCHFKGRSLPLWFLCSEISAEIVVFLKGILSCWEKFVTTLADWSYDGFWFWVTFSLGCPSFSGLYAPSASLSKCLE